MCSDAIKRTVVVAVVMVVDVLEHGFEVAGAGYSVSAIRPGRCLLLVEIRDHVLAIALNPTWTKHLEGSDATGVKTCVQEVPNTRQDRARTCALSGKAG